MSLVMEVARAKEQGAKKVEGFTSTVRSLETPYLERGDRFTFPTQYEVYELKFGSNSAQFIFIDIEDENGNKTDVVKRFYPSTFTKTRYIYNDDKTSTRKRVSTKGTAADLFRSAATVNEGMEKLKGKTVIVTDVIVVQTMRYGTDQLIDTQIPVIDLVK